MNYIHCLNNISKNGTDLLGDSYALTDDLSQASGVLVRSAAMHDMDFPESLLAIARAGAGVNNIPLDRCAEEGIVVFNTPGANANAVKELIVCSMLLACRDILGGIAWCRDNADDENIAKNVEKAKKSFAGSEILGKKLGIIGLGAIGRQVADAAIGLGMDVYGYDPFLSAQTAWNVNNAAHYVSDIKDLFAVCDFITIHVPATADTKGMIDETAFAAMKDGVVFMNFSRDTLVVNDAMAAALESGKVARYITDFAVPAVMKMPRVIVMPHLGASTAEAEDNCAIMAVHELVDYIDNGNIANSVNYPACTMGTCPDGGGRIAILHKNGQDMLGEITDMLSGESVTVTGLTNRTRGDFGYALVDLDRSAADVAGKLEAISGVIRVRVIR